MIRIAAVLIALAAPLAAADVTGKWAVIAVTGSGDLKLELNLSGVGSAMAGTLTFPAGAVPLENIAVTGDQLSFQFMLGPQRIAVALNVTGDTMAGTWKGESSEGKVTATRAGGGTLAAVKVETGEIAGSDFRIDMPENYNGTLVVYCHGYGGRVRYDDKPLAPQVRFLTEKGFAVAQAGYAGAGWAIEEALRDTEALREYFVKKHGKPKRTFVTGHSMGGIITLAIIEKYPQHYDGALPLCGPLASSLRFMQSRVFDTLVLFDYYFPGVIGSPVKLAESVRMSKDYVAELDKLMDAEPQKKTALKQWLGFQSEKEVAPLVGFFANIQKELVTRTGGNAFDNRDTIYTGGPDEPAVNHGVKRYPADPKAVEYLKRYYTPEGRPKRPVLAVHTLYDPIVPAWSTNAYGERVRETGSSELFVQRYTRNPGHCAIRPDETRRAFEDLLRWQETGQRPEPGEQAGDPK